ncbi:T9SS type A sorting domain-containing protein [Hyphobacterium sp. CCMP332]|nr:T9SS type A sorting domain-containing protein [Hyphobacterium sp. CCMP332]
MGTLLWPLEVEEKECVGINPVYEVTIQNPNVAPEGALCSDEGDEHKRGELGNILESDFTVYPNPSSNSFSIISFDPGYKYVAIYDLNGSKIDEFEYEGNNYKYNSENLKSGVYVIKIISEGKEYPIKLNVL